MNDALLYAADRGVVTLTLNRPKALNAINPDLAEGLALALDRIESDRTACAVIVTGAGDGFMAVGSIKFFTGLPPAPPAERRAASLAPRLAEGPEEATAATKQLLSGSLDRTLDAQLQAEAEAFAGCTATSDFTEAVDAFVAKRPPRFGRS